MAKRLERENFIECSGMIIPFKSYAKIATMINQRCPADGTTPTGQPNETMEVSMDKTNNNTAGVQNG